jgi:sphingomyelin phosphodiesterase
LEPNESAEF